MIIGYARVSTTEQDLNAQIEMLEQSGCDRDNIYIEKATGREAKSRETLNDMIKFARRGDTIKITRIDRLARSIIDLNKIVKEVTQKGVSIEFIQDSLHFKSGKQLDPTQELMFNVLGSFAQFERSLIVQRTTEGRERAKRQGKHMGRPSQPKKQIERALYLYKNREFNNMSVNDIAKITEVPRSTIYHELKKMKKK